MTFRDLKSFGARLSDLSRTLAGDPKTRVSDLKFKTLNNELPVLLWWRTSGALVVAVLLALMVALVVTLTVAKWR